jgi:hypothetical protein
MLYTLLNPPLTTYEEILGPTSHIEKRNYQIMCFAGVGPSTFRNLDFAH